MKVKVIKNFRDKHKKTSHAAGEEIEISKERYDEILKAGNYVEKVGNSPKATEAAKEGAKK